MDMDMMDILFLNMSKNFIEKLKKHLDISILCDNEDIYQKLRESKYKIINEIFLECHKELENQDFDVEYSGTTCVIAIQCGNYIICANAGDSRGIIVKADDSNLFNSQVIEISHDFKPDIPEEKNRILKCGGVVDQLEDNKGEKIGPARVYEKGTDYPGLAMSRSIGDYCAHRCGVLAIPECIEYTIN